VAASSVTSWPCWHLATWRLAVLKVSKGLAAGAAQVRPLARVRADVRPASRLPVPPHTGSAGTGTAARPCACGCASASCLPLSPHTGSAGTGTAARPCACGCALCKWPACCRRIRAVRALVRPLARVRADVRLQVACRQSPHTGSAGTGTAARPCACGCASASGLLRLPHTGSAGRGTAGRPCASACAPSAPRAPQTPCRTRCSDALFLSVIIPSLSVGSLASAMVVAHVAEGRRGKKTRPIFGFFFFLSGCCLRWAYIPHDRARVMASASSIYVSFITLLFVFLQK
jgi:hypothetical protein